MNRMILVDFQIIQRREICNQNKVIRSLLTKDVDSANDVEQLRNLPLHIQQDLFGLLKILR